MTINHPIHSKCLICFFCFAFLLFACQPQETQEGTSRALAEEDSSLDMTAGNKDKSVVASPENERSSSEEVIAQEENPWEVQSIEGKKLTFRNGETFQTNLFDLDYIGQLETGEGKAPVLILAGRYCQECDANKAIYFHSPAAGEMPEEGDIMRYPFPGKELYYEDGSLLNESRFFFGEVLPGTQGAIWYQNTLVEEGDYIKNAYLVQIKNGKILGDQMLKDKIPDIEKTLELVDQEKALEVPGMEYFSEP